MFKYSLAFLIMLVFLPGTARAAQQPSPRLNKLLARYQEARKITFQFRQEKRIKDLGVSLHTRGELVLTPPHGLIWKISHPQKLKVEINQEVISMTREDEQGKQTVEHLKWAQMGKTPLLSQLQGLIEVLSFREKKIRKHYQINWGKKENQLILIPKDQTQSLFQSFRFDFSKNFRLLKVLIKEKSQDQITMLLTGESLN